MRHSAGAEDSPSFSAPAEVFAGRLMLGTCTPASNSSLPRLEEERERIKQTIILILLAVLGLSLGAVLLTIFAVALFWEKGWIAAIGVMALIYLGVGGGAIVGLRKKILSRPGLFPATLSELGKDRDRLKASAGE